MRLNEISLGLTRSVKFLSGDLLVRDNRAARDLEPMSTQQLLRFARLNEVPVNRKVEQLTIDEEEITVKYFDGNVEKLPIIVKE